MSLPPKSTRCSRGISGGEPACGRPHLTGCAAQSRGDSVQRLCVWVIPGSSVVHEIHFKHLRDGTGAARCNPDGVKRLHLSAEKETAQAEFLYYAAKGGLDPNLADFYSFAVEVRLGRVLDLTSKKTRKHLSITLNEIRADWEVDPLLHPSPAPTKLQGIGYWIQKDMEGFQPFYIRRDVSAAVVISYYLKTKWVQAIWLTR